MTEQYKQLGLRILEEGEWIFNERTGKKVLTVINADMIYDVGAGEFPLDTMRKSYWRAAVAEILGYLQGCRFASEFRSLGTKTWNANANENESWLANPHRTGEDDMGRVYGVQLRDWTNSDGESFDQLMKVYNNLRNGIDDRGEILMMHNPGEVHKGCLRACMYSHTFSLVNGTLHLTSVQRSMDVPLGGNFNQVQCFALLALMARITGHRPGKVYHKIVNAHIYSDQYELFKEHMTRTPWHYPTFTIDDSIKDLSDVMNLKDTSAFNVSNYVHGPEIEYPFSV